MTEQGNDSYPALRRILGEDGFSELARLIRTTYEANEQRLERVLDGTERGGPRMDSSPDLSTDRN